MQKTINSLTHIGPMFPCCARWKHLKTVGFLTFSGGIERGILAWNGLIQYLFFISNCGVSRRMCLHCMIMLSRWHWWWCKLWYGTHKRAWKQAVCQIKCWKREAWLKGVIYKISLLLRIIHWWWKYFSDL